MNTIKQILHAASFAARKHKDQRRKGSDAVPYINHPLEVANILADIGNIDDVDILSEQYSTTRSKTPKPLSRNWRSILGHAFAVSWSK